MAKPKGVSRELERAKRELEIEAALEKVRVVAMAMNKAEDMLKISKAIGLQLTALGVREIRNVQTAIFHPERGTYHNYEYYAKHKKTIITETDYTNHKIGRDFAKTMLRGKGEFHVTHIKGTKAVQEWLAYQKTTNVFIDKYLNTATSVNYYWHSLGPVALGTSSYVPLSKEDLKLFKRFLKVFELGFRRHLDIEQAAAQTRESQVQLALERVRARTMAMQKSEELSDVVFVLFKQFRELGENPDQATIGIFNEVEQVIEYWVTMYGQQLNKAFKFSFDEPNVTKKIYNGWKAGNSSLVIGLTGKALAEFMAYRESKGGAVVNLQEKLRTINVAFFSKGLLNVQSTESRSGESIRLLERFAKVFEQTYTRFLDLQKAEASAKEAVKQAALDRIRAEIASMRNVKDLDRITPLIWTELKVLGIPFLRCGVFIMNEQEEQIHTFLSTPEGEAFAAFQTSYDEPGNYAELITHWRKRKMFFDYWQEKEFMGLATQLIERGEISNQESFLSHLPKEGMHLHFIPFEQGMLYVGNSSRLDDREIELIKSVADTFSAAYDRYEDFSRLEAAKREVDRTLVELKQAQTQLIQSEKMASLGELTAGIAHEIQNPLNFVNNFSDVSAELLGEMSAEMRKGNHAEAMAIVEDVMENLGKILHHGKRADAIVKGMLQHSRTSSGQKEPTDINSLADEYLRLAFHGLRAKDKSFNASFHTDFEEGLEKLEVIPQDIGRVFVNLISNAFYAVNEKRKKGIPGYEPTVTIATRRKESGVEIIISDNGIGIPDKVKDKIFQPFFTTKPTGQGTGLGLSLSYDIIKAHEGEMRVETKGTEGTDFIISLPG